MDILNNITEQHILIAFLIGIISACSLPLGTITTAFWKPEELNEIAPSYCILRGRAIVAHH